MYIYIYVCIYAVYMYISTVYIYIYTITNIRLYSIYSILIRFVNYQVQQSINRRLTSNAAVDQHFGWWIGPDSLPASVTL